MDEATYIIEEVMGEYYILFLDTKTNLNAYYDANDMMQVDYYANTEFNAGSDYFIHEDPLTLESELEWNYKYINETH
jgi:hypothetical protein